MSELGYDPEEEFARIVRLKPEHVDDPPISEPEAVREAFEDPALQVRSLADIEPEEVTWLWPGRIPYGKLTVLAGDPGVGKSYVSLAIATAVTRGGALPGDEKPSGPGDVLIATYEDGPADTLRPRADLLGADVDRLSVIDGVTSDGRVRPFSAADTDKFADYLSRVKRPQLLIIDPLAAFMGGDTDTYKDNEVRAALEDLRRLAADWDIAVLCVMHLRKSAATNALARLSGSGAYGQLVRSALLAGRHPDQESRCALAHIKHNLSAKQPTLGYQIDGDGFSWLGEESGLDGERLAGHESEVGFREEAKRFLQTLLSEGPVPSRQVKAEAKDADISEATLRRAKKALGVRAEKSSMKGAWCWKFPEGVQTSDVNAFGGEKSSDTATQSQIREDVHPPAQPKMFTPPDHLRERPQPDQDAREELPICYGRHQKAWRRNGAPWKCGVCHPPVVPESAEWYEPAKVGVGALAEGEDSALDGSPASDPAFVDEESTLPPPECDRI